MKERAPRTTVFVCKQDEERAAWLALWKRKKEEKGKRKLPKASSH